MSVPLLSRGDALMAVAVAVAVGTNSLGLAASLDQDLQVTRQRPLFSPDRRPPVRPAPEPADAAMPVSSDPVPTFAVRGIVMGDHRRFAIVQRPNDTRPISLSVGSELDGWTVDEIRPRGITVHRDMRTVTLVMSSPR